MALGAIQCRMFSQQRIFRSRVVKRKRGQQFFPAWGCMAVFATLLERAFVRIDVAIGASRKLNVFVTRRSTRHIGLMALFACNLNVRASERIARFRVIKLLGRFPVCEVVALQAIVPKLSFVRIFVTRHTFPR